MKKLIALLLVAVMALSVFAACTPSEDPTDPPETTTTPKNDDTTPDDTTTTPADDGEIDTSWIIEEDPESITGEITFAIPFKLEQGMGDMVAEFNETYPNIKVNIHTYSNTSDGQLQMRTAVMGGTIDVWAAFGLISAYRMWENDLGYDLTDLVEEEGIDLVEQWGFDCYTYEDSIYSFPCGGLSYYVAINMTAWEEAGLADKYNGLPTEWTWDEYIEASKLMTEYNADGSVAVYGGSDYHSTNYFMYCNAQVNGGDLYFDADGTSSYDSEVMLKALNRKIKAELEDEIWYPQARYRAESIQAQMTFCNGEVNSVVIPNVTRFLHDTKTYPDVDWITGFAPWPTEEAGQTNYMSGVTPFSHAGISSYISEEKFDAAWAWLKWYSTYGVKYLIVAGHQPNWRGTDTSSLVDIIYGSKEEAEKWIDVESFSRVVGISTNPMFAEVTLTAYADVTSALGDPIMQCINGEITPEACLQQALAEAEAAIEDAE